MIITGKKKRRIGNDNVVMCGTMDGTIHLGSQLDPELYRSISKIELNLTVSADCKYEVISARLCNVPSKIYWADYLRYEQSEMKSPLTFSIENSGHTAMQNPTSYLQEIHGHTPGICHAMPEVSSKTIKETRKVRIN